MPGARYSACVAVRHLYMYVCNDSRVSIFGAVPVVEIVLVFPAATYTGAVDGALLNTSSTRALEQKNDV